MPYLCMTDHPIKTQGIEDQVILMFVNVHVSLGTASLRHAAVGCVLRISVLFLALQFREAGCTLLYKTPVGLWSS